MFGLWRKHLLIFLQPQKIVVDTKIQNNFIAFICIIYQIHTFYKKHYGGYMVLLLISVLFCAVDCNSKYKTYVLHMAVMIVFFLLFFYLYLVLR